MGSLADWKGLLKWSMQYQDGTADTNAVMSEEKKKWLDNVMKNLVVDEVARMGELIDYLQLCNTRANNENAGSNSQPFENEEEDTILDRFEELQDIVAQIDYAVLFCKMGGFQFMEELSASSNGLLKAHGLGLAAAVAQNNPQVQGEMLANEWLPKLMNLARSSSNDLVRFKSLSAISCLIRGVPAAERQFLHQGGIDVVGACVQPRQTISLTARLKQKRLEKENLKRASSSEEAGAAADAKVDIPSPDAFRMYRKAVFLAKVLALSDHVKTEAVQALLPLLPVLIQFTGSADVDLREQSAYTILAILEGNRNGSTAGGEKGKGKGDGKDGSDGSISGSDSRAAFDVGPICACMASRRGEIAAMEQEEAERHAEEVEIWTRIEAALQHYA